MRRASGRRARRNARSTSSPRLRSPSQTAPSRFAFATAPCHSTVNGPEPPRGAGGRFAAIPSGTTWTGTVTPQRANTSAQNAEGTQTARQRLNASVQLGGITVDSANE